jgi:hypothetical protein
MGAGTNPEVVRNDHQHLRGDPYERDPNQSDPAKVLFSPFGSDARVQKWQFQPRAGKGSRAILHPATTSSS